MADGSCCDLKKDKEKRRRIDRVDRISELPEPIVHHIMSFLPFDQLVRTRGLSKSWLQAYLTFPILEIDEKYPNNIWWNDIRWKNVLKARSYWAKVLQFRHRNTVSIDQLTLKTSGESALKLANLCIRYAVENNVRELKLEHSLPSGIWFDLPEIVLRSKFLKVLKLRGYKLESLRNDVRLPLRKLSLSNVYADDQVINNLVAQCHLIEDLEFVHCEGFKTLDITSCKNLKCLSLLGWGSFTVTDGWLCSQIPRLPLLERLRIFLCGNIKSINIISPSLKILGIHSCGKLDEVKLDTPNLNKFKYKGDLISFSSAALTLSETHLYFSSNIDSQLRAKYIELLARFHKFSKVLNLESYSSENVHVPGELRLSLPHPLSGAKHLNLSLGNRNFEVAKVVDSLLWMSPHVETACLDCYDYKRLNFQFSYKQQPVYEGDTAQCCKSLPVSCWEHCITRIDIEVVSTYNKVNVITEELQSSTKVERLVFEGENLLEKIDGLVDSSVSNYEYIGVQSWVESIISSFREWGVSDIEIVF